MTGPTESWVNDLITSITELNPALADAVTQLADDRVMNERLVLRVVAKYVPTLAAITRGLAHEIDTLKESLAEAHEEIAELRRRT